MIEKDFDFWIENNLNVIFRGKAGCGKTARIIEALEKHNIKYKYFSASTIDPWVDFVGIPKEVTDENGHSYISFVRPKEIEYDEIEAIVLDEYNRANVKVLNATMELIQFKTINGKKLGKLRFIWAAVNINEGDEDTYSVQKIDPAQLDRFQVHVDVPYQLDKSYFKQKYGEDVYFAVNEWWKGLADKLRDQVSPRRVDYALEVWRANGNIAHIIPKSVNPYDLLARLSSGSYEKQFDSLVLANESDKWKLALQDINFSDWILKNSDKTKILKNIMLCLSYFGDESISKLIQEKSKDKVFLEDVYKDSRMKNILEQIISANTAARKIVKNLLTFYDSKNGKQLIVMTKEMVKEYNIVYSTLDSTTDRRRVAYDFNTTVLAVPLNKKEIMSLVMTLLILKKRSNSYTYRNMIQGSQMHIGIQQLKLLVTTNFADSTTEQQTLMHYLAECENFYTA